MKGKLRRKPNQWDIKGFFWISIKNFFKSWYIVAKIGSWIVRWNNKNFFTQNCRSFFTDTTPVFKLKIISLLTSCSLGWTVEGKWKKRQKKMNGISSFINCPDIPRPESLENIPCWNEGIFFYPFLRTGSKRCLLYSIFDIFF